MATCVINAFYFHTSSDCILDPQYLNTAMTFNLAYILITDINKGHKYLICKVVI